MTRAMVLVLALVAGCAESRDASTCPYTCETAVSCEGDTVVLRGCDVEEREYRNVFCDARAATLETLDQSCVRSCRARGACEPGDDTDSVLVTVCNCPEEP